MFETNLFFILLFVFVVPCLFWIATLTNLRGGSYKAVTLKESESTETKLTVDSINRVEAVYKGLKHLPELTVLGFLFPLVALLLVPAIASNWLKRKRFISDYESGKVIIPKNENSVNKEGELTTMEKVGYIIGARKNFKGPLLVIAWYSFLAIATGVIIFLNLPSPG